MPSERFAQRLKVIEEQRLPAPRESGHGTFERVVAVVFAIGGASLCFLVLKGMTLAYVGPEQFAAMTAALNSREGGFSAGNWLTGVDPVSQTIADLLRPSFQL